MLYCVGSGSLGFSFNDFLYNKNNQKTFISVLVSLFVNRFVIKLHDTAKAAPPSLKLHISRGDHRVSSSFGQQLLEREHMHWYSGFNIHGVAARGRWM